MLTTLALRFLFAPASGDGGGRTERRERHADTTAKPQSKSALPTKTENVSDAPLIVGRGASGASASSAHEVDRDLVIRIRSGDTMAFATVFREHYPALVRALTHYGEGTDTAEDIAQEVFLQVWEGRAAIDVDRSFRGYLYMLGRNKIFNVLKHDNIRRRHIELVQTQQETSTTPLTAPPADDIVLADDLARVIANQLKLLSPRQREIYYLSREEQLSATQIAEMLGITTQTVYVQLGRIVRALYPVLDTWVNDDP